MKKPIKQKTNKATKTIEINHNAPRFVRPLFSFMGSFIIIVGFILGLYWYGKQIVKGATLLFRAPLAIQLPITQTISSNLYDPLSLVEDVKKANSRVVIVDIRSAQEYKMAHVKNAVSLPFYTLTNDSIRYLDIQETIKHININKSKTVVVYGPSVSFQQQHTIVQQLRKNGYSAQLLAVGWNELRHFQNIWIPEGLWGKLDVNSIISTNE